MEKRLEELQAQIVTLGEELSRVYREVQEQTNRQRDLEQVVLKLQQNTKRRGK